MIRQTFPVIRAVHLQPLCRLRRAFVTLCAVWLACWAVSTPASGLRSDSAEQLPLTDSLTQALLPVELPGGQVLAEQDLALLLASLQMPPTQIPPDASERVRSVLSHALAMLGTPYRWGGTTPTGGFDCSGLVNYVFRTALGIELPRVSRDMARGGEPVERSALTAGDLVFFSRKGRTVSHVGIYLGDGRFVHAPRTGRDVTISRLNTGYWHQRFLRARRVPDLHQ